jgi:hypothetical protein
MKIYKCDGETFYGSVNCSNSIEREEPTEWITISGVVNNGLKDRKNISSGMELHFCSKECLNNYLFKNKPDTKELVLINEGFEFNLKHLDIKQRIERKHEFAKYIESKYSYCITDIRERLNSVFDYTKEEKDYLTDDF